LSNQLKNSSAIQRCEVSVRVLIALCNDPFSASHAIPTLTRISQNVFLNLRYEDHNNFIGTDLLNLIGSPILVSYFFSCLSISTLLYPGYLYYEA
jgi:hypothetical protein